MNADELLEYFDRIAEAPDSVQRLRRFILDLAVRGKLVEQNPNDEPASELLKKVVDEKTKQLQEGNIRNVRAAPKFDSEDIAFTLPKGWVWTQMSEIGFINPRNVADDGVLASFIPMPMIPAEYGSPNQHELKPWGEIKNGYTHFAEGDVALAKITPCFENGKSVIFRKLSNGIGAGTTELHVVRPILISSEYILIFLKSPHYIETGKARMTGSAGQKRVPSVYFTSSPFPLPPLQEQTRIVSRVNELMALCDELESAQETREVRRDRLVAASLHHINSVSTAGKNNKKKRKETNPLQKPVRFHLDNLSRLATRSEHIKQLRQSILNLAVSGRLVTPDSSSKAVDELIAKIAQVTGNQNVEYEPDVPQFPFAIPDSWKWRLLGDITTKTGSGSTPRGGRSVYKDSGIKFLRSQNIHNDGLRLDDVAYIDEATHSRMGGSAVQPNDLLLNITGGSIGRCCRLPDTDFEANVSQHVSIIRLAIPEMVDYIHKVILSPYFQSFVIDEQTGAGRGGLPKRRMDRILVPLPSISEQQRIINTVEVLMRLCDELEARLEATEMIKHRLLEAVLHEALSTKSQRRSSVRNPQAVMAVG